MTASFQDKNNYMMDDATGQMKIHNSEWCPHPLVPSLV